VDDPVGNKDHEEEDEASEISIKVTHPLSYDSLGFIVHTITNASLHL
jgi:hypothetical protein